MWDSFFIPFLFLLTKLEYSAIAAILVSNLNFSNFARPIRPRSSAGYLPAGRQGATAL
jgi:hypothetical protein